jgi:hypothetical protein
LPMLKNVSLLDNFKHKHLIEDFPRTTMKKNISNKSPIPNYGFELNN